MERLQEESLVKGCWSHPKLQLLRISPYIEKEFKEVWTGLESIGKCMQDQELCGSRGRSSRFRRAQPCSRPLLILEAQGSGAVLQNSSSISLNTANFDAAGWSLGFESFRVSELPTDCMVRPHLSANYTNAQTPSSKSLKPVNPHPSMLPSKPHTSSARRRLP